MESIWLKPFLLDIPHYIQGIKNNQTMCLNSHTERHKSQNRNRLYVQKGKYQDLTEQSSYMGNAFYKSKLLELLQE